MSSFFWGRPARTTDRFRSDARHYESTAYCRSENVCGLFGSVLPTRGVNVQSDWTRLFRIARAMIEQVNSEQQIIDHWTFGGGTAMMLQINHRESDDVDIFLQDAQLLSFLDPQKRDFDFEIGPSDYKGAGSTF